MLGATEELSMASNDAASPLGALAGKRVVVTGGTGAFGRSFVAELRRARASVLVLSRDEMKHAPLRKEWTSGESPVDLRIGDVTRREDLELAPGHVARSEEHTSELQSQSNLVC